MTAAPASKPVVVAMSTAGLDYHPEAHGVRILRLNIKTGNETYIDGLTISCEEFQHWLLTHPTELANTSPPSSLNLRRFFVSLMDEGYTEVLFVGMSSALSKTCEQVRQIVPLLENQMKIHVFDTKTGTFTEGLMALEAEKCFAKGWSMKKTLQHLERLRDFQRVYFGVDNLNYLVNNGRLSKASGMLANFLNIKPLIHVNRNGEAEVKDRIFSTERLMYTIADLINSKIDVSQYHVFTLYSGSSSASLHRELQNVLTLKCGLQNLPSYPISPVVAAHIGPHAYGAGLFKM